MIKLALARFPLKQLLSLLPWLILALGLGLTVILWRNARQDTARTLEAEFQFWVSRIIYSIEARLSNNVQVLRGVTGLFDASENITREEFRRYVEALHLAEHYPGIQGIGFAQFISSDKKAAHEAAIRREGFPDYAIRPTGEREFYTAVLYLEPFTGRNMRAFGYDMAPEPVRWAAAARARDEGQAALSGKVILQQETATDIQPGFVLFVPVYRYDAPHATRDARRANLIGWAFSPLRMRDLMHGVLGTLDFDSLRTVLNVEIYDGISLAPDALLFSLEQAAAATSNSAFRALRRLEFGGQWWSVQATSTPRFEARLHGRETTLIALGGSVVSLLLALLIGVMTSSQRQIATALGETARTLAELQEAEAALHFTQTVVDRMSDAAYWASPDGRLIYANAAASQMIGYTLDELLALSMSDIVLDYTDDHWAAHWRELKQAGSLRFESGHRRKTGEIVPVEIHVDYMQFQDIECACGLVRDITERKQAQESLREQAIRDPLTGLFNRRYLDEILPHELSRRQRSGEPLTAAMLDLDHFKHFNDAYGHEAGDGVLRAVGDLLRRSLRASDLACRYGGEELTIILPGSTLEDAWTRLDSLRQAIMQMHIPYRSGELPAITISIGIAAARAEETAAVLLGRADDALYRAKEQGRNCMVAADGCPLPSG